MTEFDSPLDNRSGSASALYVAESVAVTRGFESHPLYLGDRMPDINVDRIERPESPAQEADRLVNGDRQADYGHPLDDFTKTGTMWGAILQIGRDVTPEEVALCMVEVKVARQVHKPKRDNIVDAIGYLLTYDLIEKERARRALLAPDPDLENIPF